MDEKVDQSQVERFKEIAQMMECDDDSEHFQPRQGKLMTHKPLENPE